MRLSQFTTAPKDAEYALNCQTTSDTDLQPDPMLGVLLEKVRRASDVTLTLEPFQGVRYTEEVRMRVLPVLCIFGSLAALPPSLVARQDHHAHAERVMGFDQERTAHHFLLFKDGGAIDVSVKDAGDTKNREAIRSHLPHIALMFGNGNFDAPMLVHDSANVPGTKVMTARKEAIRYQYAETPNGGRVTIVASEPEALDAVHAFLKYQIAEHKTGDPATVRPR